ncbi:hypothetical protein SLS64_003923 [Diaporthe eres]
MAFFRLLLTLLSLSSFFPGSNNINDGVLVAFDLMQELDVDETAQTIAYGPGTRWVDVYGALDAYGLYCIGGRLKTIGTAGLTLIGGWHYMNNKYGYAMDNVISYDVVLGNGTQVVASNSSNPELFWALKGGALNFGIVTRFLVQAYPIPQISTTIQAFSEDQIEAFVSASCDLAENDDPSIGAGGVITITYNTTTKTASGSLLGVQEGTESPPSRFEAFSAINPVSRMDAVKTPKEWHSTLETPNQMFRAQSFHGTMRPDAKRLYEIYLAWRESVAEISDVEGLYPTFVMNIMPKSSLSVAKNNGVGNVWGMDDDQSYIIWQTSTGWANAQDDLRVTGWASKFKDYHHSVNHDLGIANDFIYMGDASETQNPWLGMPFENIQRMRQVRADYDPKGVFTVLNWGGYKLGQ